MNLSATLSNFSFLILFISMLIYWVDSVNLVSDMSKNEKIDKIKVSPPSNMDESNLSNFGNIGVVLSNLSLFLLLCTRWMESGHFPLSNLYESLIFLSWGLTSLHLIINFDSFILFQNPAFISLFNKGKELDTTEELSSYTRRKKKILSKFIGAIIAPSALFTNAFASFSLPVDMQNSSPLVPALQSNWLMMHVTVMVLSYAALIIGSLLSIGFLVISITQNKTDRNIKASFSFPFSTPAPSPVFQGVRERFPSERSLLSVFDGTQEKSLNEISVERYAKEGQTEKQVERLGDNSLKINNENTLNYLEISEPRLDKGISINLPKILDNLSYRILGIGFPLLTIGILSGAVWANEAWGTYWSWDPKETWALLTWLVFAIYLHTRLNKGWEGKKPAIIASFGFLIVWICFLGVNLLGEGLHSYGWLNQN